MFRMFYRLAQDNEKGISSIEKIMAEKRTRAHREESRTNLEYLRVEKFVRRYRGKFITKGNTESKRT